MKNILLALAILTLPMLASAQNALSDTLVWDVTSTLNLKNNETFAYTCQFKTIGANQVEWIQKNGTRTTEFNVSQSVGAWTDIAQLGSVQHTISKNGESASGYIILARTSEGLIITLDFTQQGVNGIQQRFFVAQVQPTN